MRLLEMEQEPTVHTLEYGLVRIISIEYCAHHVSSILCVLCQWHTVHACCTSSAQRLHAIWIRWDLQ